MALIPAGQPMVVFGLGIGPVPVSLRWDDGGLTFAWMTQLRPAFGPAVAALDAVAEALGVAESDIRSTGVPVQEVSCGMPFLMVPLATRAAVDAAALDRAGLVRLCGRLGSRPTVEVFLFSTEAAGDGATAYSRMFAPGLGVAEDPATGAASGPLGCYLVRHRVVGSRRRGPHRQPPGCGDGAPQPDSHCHRGNAGRDYTRACRRLGRDRWGGIRDLPRRRALPDQMSEMLAGPVALNEAPRRRA